MNMHLSKFCSLLFENYISIEIIFHEFMSIFVLFMT